MEQLPQDIIDIINEYKNGAEHFDKNKAVILEVVHHFWMTRKIRMNYQFNTIFFPDFYHQLWPEHEDIDIVVPAIEGPHNDDME